MKQKMLGVRITEMRAWLAEANTAINPKALLPPHGLSSIWR